MEVNLKGYCDLGKRWPAWAGEASCFPSLAETMEEPARKYRDADLARLTTGSTTDEELRAERELILSQYACEMTVKRGRSGFRRSGPVGDIDGQLGGEKVDMANLSVGRGKGVVTFGMAGVGPIPYEDTEWFAADIVMRRKDGVALFVRGSNDHVVRGSFANLAYEVKQGVPWYAFLRAWWMWLIYAATAATAAIVALLPSLSGSGGQRAWSWVGVVGGAVVVGSLVFTMARRLIPGVEIPGPGEEPKGRRAVAVIGVAVLNVGLGVLLRFVA